MTDDWRARLHHIRLMAEMVSGERIPLTHRLFASWRQTLRKGVLAHGWTQADHEAILDRPRVVEPSKPFIRGFGE